MAVQGLPCIFCNRLPVTASVDRYRVRHVSEQGAQVDVRNPSRPLLTNVFVKLLFAVSETDNNACCYPDRGPYQHQ